MTIANCAASDLQTHGERFRRALRDPALAQARVLRSILERNAGCEYGRRHDFAAITSAASYRARVPIVGYEDLRRDIERMASGDPGVLTTEPVVAFEQTGGSGGAKLVPYTAAGLAEFQAGLLPWLDALHALVPDIGQGRSYWSISPACRAPALTPAGMRIGMPSDAAYFGDAFGRRLLALLAVRPEVGALQDIAAWRRQTLLQLAACTDLVLISVWSPTFLLELLRHLLADAEEIARELAESALAATASDTHARAPFDGSSRAHALLRVARMAQPDWRILWPRLALISCWDQAQARPYAQQLKQLFPGVILQGKGLLATEGLVSIPLDATADPVMALESGYFEFVDRAGRAHGVEEVAVGDEYDLLLTTSSGLYRYAIGDRVCVTGFVERTPTLRFLGRSGVTCDLCGEKLDEAFVGTALRALDLPFAMLVPERDPPGYALVLDAEESLRDDAQCAAETVERVLRANPQYDYARRMGQLAPLRIRRARDPLAAWIARGVARGQRLSDIKLPALYPDDAWRTHFELTS